MSTVTRVSAVITEDNKAELLARIRGRTHREVDAIVAESNHALPCATW